MAGAKKTRQFAAQGNCEIASSVGRIAETRGRLENVSLYYFSESHATMGRGPGEIVYE